jgi:riboflavin kinase
VFHLPGAKFKVEEQTEANGEILSGHILNSQVINGVVYSDLGQASSFMALDWVQRELKNLLGFAPFPATLNVRPEQADIETWREVRTGAGIPLPPANGGFCAARLYPVKIQVPAKNRTAGTGAVLLPEVDGYPENKIEVIAGVRLKESLGIHDGDRVLLEFGD